MLGSKKVLGIIPARGGSKGVSGKNIVQVGGHPLIEWTILAAKASRHLDRVILSSDDEGIINIAQRAGCEAPFRRSAALSTDEATSVDVVIDALDRVPGYDVAVLLQPTSPLRTADDIDAALQNLLASRGPSCASVCAASEHPYLMFSRKEDGRLRAYLQTPETTSLRRQDLPPAFILNGAIYAAEVDWIYTQRRLFLDGVTSAYVMPGERSHDIDTWEDVELTNELLLKLSKISRAEERI
jgi:N-acylneuraminate cytidylyltransferase